MADSYRPPQCRRPADHSPGRRPPATATGALPRRQVLGGLAALPIFAGVPAMASAAPLRQRVRPGDPGWPSDAAWAALGRQVGGRLVRVRSPLETCLDDPIACEALFERLRNPYFIGDEPGLTQTLGWIDAWTSAPSAWAVVARDAADVAAAVSFARTHHLRLVVRGGGHSYKGTSSAPDSLMIWTKLMDDVRLHAGFVPTGCAAAPVPAVSVGAGALWGRVYDAVSTRGGRYVQGGGCLTVGVAGLVFGGGFGNFSKAYGLAAASLLEVEVVTADGAVGVANPCTNPDLFWALRGGGAGFGVITRLTLATHDLPEWAGAVFAAVEATSDAAFRRLIDRTLAFYAERLCNPHWGEQIAVRPGNVLAIGMVFQGLDRAAADAIWRPYFASITYDPELRFASTPTVLAVPARSFWDPEVLHRIPGVLLADDRPGAPATNVFWASNREEAGQVLHGYQSAWLPAALLEPDRRGDFAAALFTASRHWPVALHANKGLAGAPAHVREAARTTAVNPAVADAFALAISGAEGPPAWPGIPGREPDHARARREAAGVRRAMGELRTLAPDGGAYALESDYFQADWQAAFWGANYPRLQRIKQAVDPDGLFFAHHAVGSEGWSRDGFTPLG